MAKKDWIYGTIIIILFLLLIFKVLPDIIEYEPEPPRKNSTEKYLRTCEVYEICDYTQDWFCPGMHDCPEIYKCWEESRYCRNQPTKLFSTRDFELTEEDKIPTVTICNISMINGSKRLKC